MKTILKQMKNFRIILLILIILFASIVMYAESNTNFNYSLTFGFYNDEPLNAQQYKQTMQIIDKRLKQCDEDVYMLTLKDGQIFLDISLNKIDDSTLLMLLGENNFSLTNDKHDELFDNIDIKRFSMKKNVQNNYEVILHLSDFGKNEFEHIMDRYTNSSLTALLNGEFISFVPIQRSMLVNRSFIVNTYSKKLDADIITSILNNPFPFGLKKISFINNNEMNFSINSYNLSNSLTLSEYKFTEEFSKVLLLEISFNNFIYSEKTDLIEAVTKNISFNVGSEKIEPVYYASTIKIAKDQDIKDLAKKINLVYYINDNDLKKDIIFTFNGLEFGNADYTYNYIFDFTT